MRSSIIIALGIACSVAGCTRAISVQVVDAQSGKPIPGASVERWAVLRPYFIVGALAPHDRCETDPQGAAQIKSRRGGLHVSAPGYEKGHASLETKESQITVELKPVERKSATD